MYINREDAGQKLGRALEKYQSVRPLVLGIPRGGIEVGFYVAQHLNCDFDAIVVRKLGHPQQKEAAFGALAEDGSLYLDPWSNKYLSKEIIEQVINQEKKEIKRRINVYRGGKALPDLTNRVVILVDDGIATGATIFAAIAMCRKRNPRKVVVAAPISGLTQIDRLQKQADELVIPERRARFLAVSQGYEDFANLSDKEVQGFMNQWRAKAGREVSPDQ